MKRIITNIVSLSFMLISFSFMPSLVMAEATSTDSSTSSEDKPQTNYEIDDKTKAEYRANLEARIKAKKEAMQNRADVARENIVKAKCRSSQSLINKVSEKASSAKTSRDEIYNNMIKNAVKLSDRMKTNGQDTTKLDANIAELNTLIEKFKIDLKDMRQLAQDITEMDCETDPAGFSTLLDEIRSSRELVAQDSAAIRAYIKDTLKPTLQEIRNTIGQVKQESQEVQDGAQ